MSVRGKALLLLAASLAAPAALADTVRPEVGKYLVQAEKLVNAQKYAAALHAVDEAQALGHLTPYETQVTAELRGAAAAEAGQYELAAQSYAAVLAAGGQSAPQTLAMTQAIVGYYDSAGDQANTIEWVKRYEAAGGKNASIRALATQAEYAQGRYQAVLASVQADEQAGRVPVAELQLGASAAQKAGDKQAYFDALQKLLTAAPSPAAWNAAITLVQSAPDFPDGLTIDLYRLREATGTLTQASDIEDYAERAILAGEPQEARAALDAGFNAGILTTQTDNGHAARLRKLAGQKAQGPQAASAQPGDALATGLAALLAGDKTTATQQLSTVPGYAQGQLTPPRAALARLGNIAAQQHG